MSAFIPSKKLVKSDKVVISIRIDENKLNRIDTLSIKADISRNEFINQCIDFALNNIEMTNMKKNKNSDEKNEKEQRDI